MSLGLATWPPQALGRSEKRCGGTLTNDAFYELPSLSACVPPPRTKSNDRLFVIRGDCTNVPQSRGNMHVHVMKEGEQIDQAHLLRKQSSRIFPLSCLFLSSITQESFVLTFLDIFAEVKVGETSKKQGVLHPLPHLTDEVGGPRKMHAYREVLSCNGNVCRGAIFSPR